MLVNEPVFSQRVLKKNIARLKSLMKLWLSKVMVVKRAFDLEYGALYGLLTFWAWGYLSLYGTLADVLLLISFLLLSTALLNMTVPLSPGCLKAYQDVHYTAVLGSRWQSRLNRLVPNLLKIPTLKVIQVKMMVTPKWPRTMPRFHCPTNVCFA